MPRRKAPGSSVVSGRPAGLRRLTRREPHPYTDFVRWFQVVSVASFLAASFAALPVRAVGGSNSVDGEPPTIHSLIAASDLIVVGKITRTAQVERDNDLQDISYNGTRRYIAIIATIAVEETLMGEAPLNVKFVYPKKSRLKGEPVYDVDQDGVWLLRRSELKTNEYLADEVGRFQSRDRKEQVKAIIAKFSIKNVGDGKNDGGDKPPTP